MKVFLSLVTAVGVLMMSSSVLAQGSMLRIGCDGNDVGAEVSINGKFKGECPLDIQVSAGNQQLRIVKKVDASRERVFEQEVRIGDGTVKRIDARLGPVQLNAEGLRLEALRAEEAKRRDEARQREVALAQQRKLEAQASALAEFKAQGIEAGTGKVFRDCADCPEMVWIPPGRPPQRAAGSNEFIAWLNEVTIAYPLAIAKFETTYDEWDLCVAESACNKVEEGVTNGFFFDKKWGRGRQPVINVPLAEAQRYLAWLSKKSGQQYRLLSLAEFTYAARGGQLTKLPWGDEIGRNNANCRNCGSSLGGERPAPVGSFPPNGWGLHDMVGNVAEMVSDCARVLNDLDKVPRDGSPISTGCATTTPPDSRKVLGDRFFAMGGSWNSEVPLGIPVETFYEKYPGPILGFRVARTFMPAASLSGTPADKGK